MSAQVAVLGIAIGLLLSLLSYVITNISPGGMITPGWLAVTIVDEPPLLVLLVLVTAITYALTKLLQRVVILYGKRLFSTMVMLAVFTQMTFILIGGRVDTGTLLPFANRTLGFIVPGLVAYQLVRQPPLATALSTSAVTAVTLLIMYAGIQLGFIAQT